MTNYNCTGIHHADRFDKARGDCWTCWTNRGKKVVASPAPKARAGKPAKKPLPTYPCVHRGEPTGERVLCGTCGGGVQLPVQACAIKGRCVVAKEPKDGAIQCCAKCKEREEPTNLLQIGPPPAAVRWPLVRADDLPFVSKTRVDLPDHFNASIIEYKGQTLLASRLHQSLFLSELNPATLQPIWTRFLPLYCSQSQNGAEDPRLFVHDGRLHVQFNGVKAEPKLTISVLHARLTDDLRVEKIWEPVYKYRRPQEKNWAPFEVDDVLYSVYDAGPRYVVLKHYGETATLFVEHQWKPEHSWGVMRGGAAPMLVGDEFWCFAHGVRKTKNAIDTDYTLGLYTFDAKPPFAPRRIVPTPLMFDLTEKRPRTENPAIYPCGAIRRDASWFISYGLHNSHVEIVEYRHDDLERLLVTV